MAEGLGIKSSAGDGNDVAEVYLKTIEALSCIRAGEGPQFLEFSTYRWLEHCGPNYDNDLGYRTEAEYLAWKLKEPIDRFEVLLLAEGIISATEIKLIELDIKLEVSSAFEFADASPFPAAASAYTDLYNVHPLKNGTQSESVEG
jgi:pyruvate dehydrogenase E1 component alpha subunit